MSNLRLLAVSMVVLLPAVAAADPPSPDATGVDYEAAFAKSFPVVAGEHHIIDWKLYTALVVGDVVTYAAKVDPAVAAQFEQTKGKAYQTHQLEALIKDDKRLRAAFDDQRRRLKSMVVYTDGAGVGSDTCRHSLVYVAEEFRLVFGASAQGEDAQARTTVAPSCPRPPEPGFQITAGYSPRFKCWTSEQTTTCAWRLPDMPVELKRVIENEYPSSIKLRWRWRGLGAVARVRYVDSYGNLVKERDRIALTIPVDLGLEFVDRGDRILWTAAAAGWSKTNPFRPRQ